MLAGPIIIIEDDADDQYIFQKIIRELNVPNTIRFFNNGQLVLDYLQETEEQPFLIICDINMPLMNGLELRKCIERDEPMKKKIIPFIFLTTDASPALIQEAYEVTIQGFFKKTTGYEATKRQLEQIIGYWSLCLHPNSEW